MQFKFVFSQNQPLIKLERRQLKNNGEFINLYVSLVSSPLSFVIQLEDDLKQLNEIMGDLQKHCKNSAQFSSLTDIQKGECYAVYDDDSRMWIRLDEKNNFIFVLTSFCICILVHPLRISSIRTLFIASMLILETSSPFHWIKCERCQINSELYQSLP